MAKVVTAASDGNEAVCALSHRYLAPSFADADPDTIAMSPAKRGAPSAVVETGACGVVVGTVGTVAVNRGPIGGIAVSADGRRLVVTNYGDDSVSVIDTDTCAVVHTVFAVGEPFAIATDTGGGGNQNGRAYVGTVSAASDAVMAIDMDTADVAAAYPVAFSISDLAVDPTGQRIYVARTAVSGVDVTVIDAAQGPIGAVDLSTAPGVTTTCVRIGPDGRRLYVAVRRPGGDVVAVMDPDLKLVDTIEVGSTIRDVAVHPDGGTVFIARCDPVLGGVADIVDTHATNAITGRFEVGDPLTQLTVSGDGERVYLVTAAGVVVMCARTYRFVGVIAVDSPPSCAVESPDGNRLYIADYEGAVTAVSVASRPASLPAPDLFDDSIATLLELAPAV